MNQAAENLIAVSRAHLTGADVDLKRLRELASAVHAQRVWEASPGFVVKLMDLSDGVKALLDIIEAPRGTNAQILMEREITASSIQGAMAFGYQNTNPPPAEDRWLQPFWDIGRKQAEMEREIEVLRELRDAVITQREMYADTSDEDNMSGKQITAALDRVAAVASKGGGT